MKRKVHLGFMLLILSLSITFMVSCRDTLINTQYNYNNADSYTFGEGKIEASKIKNIDIDWIDGNVFVDYSEDSNIRFYEAYSKDIKDEFKMHYNVLGNTLYIKFAKATKNLIYDGGRKNLYIRIPNTITLNTFECNMVSSSTTVKALKADTIHIHSVSGTIDCYNFESDDIKLTSSSGTIYAKNVTSALFSIETTSGKANLENIKSSLINLETTSGNIISTNLETEKINTESTSSSIILRFKSSPNNILVDTISGDTYLYLPHDMKFMLNYDTVSGNFNHSFELFEDESNLYDYSTVDPTSQIDVMSISGNLDINISN